MFGLNGERKSVCFGFSRNPVTSPLRATSTPPNRETSCGSIGSVASVTSAPESRCWRSILP